MKTLVFFILLFSAFLKAEFEEKDVSARVEAMGGACVALCDDPSAVHYNPAGVALNFRRQLLSNYSRIYNMDELIHQYLGVTTPLLPFCNLGFGVERFGTGKYQEDKLSVSVARQILEGHRIGFTVNNFETKIESTLDRRARGIDLGLISDLGKKARIGFSARNVNHPFVNEQLKAYYRAGFLFYPNDRLKVLMDFEKPQTVLNEDKTTYHLGQELEIADGVFVRLGFRTQPQRLSFGFGVCHREVNLDYSFTSHVDLSGSHRVSLGIKF